VQFAVFDVGVFWVVSSPFEFVVSKATDRDFVFPNGRDGGLVRFLAFQSFDLKQSLYIPDALVDRITVKVVLQ
jgi:hypothetical protein